MNNIYNILISDDDSIYVFSYKDDKGIDDVCKTIEHIQIGITVNHVGALYYTLFDVHRMTAEPRFNKKAEDVISVHWDGSTWEIQTR